jgi:5-methylthioribose kinase
MTDLDIEQPAQLAAFLERKGLIAPGEAIRSQALPGGVSNRTVLVERPNGDAWVLKQALAQLRVQVEWFSDPDRIHNEAAGMRCLGELLPPGSITAFLFEDEAQHVVAMSAVPQPYRNWKAMLLEGDLQAGHVVQFGELLGIMHRRGAEPDRHLDRAFADRAYFESLRLEPYYLFTAAKVPQAGNFFNRLVSDTRQTRLTLVHGDYSPKNILVHNDRLVLLDHEVIHFGDPAFDLGFSLTHLLSKAHHLESRRLAFAQAAELYWRTYLKQLGQAPWLEDLEERAVRHTLGCLLARVAGRSPLEYLSVMERQRQQECVLTLIDPIPKRIPDLIDRFVTLCNSQTLDPRISANSH